MNRSGLRCDHLGRKPAERVAGDAQLLIERHPAYLLIALRQRPPGCRQSLCTCHRMTQPRPPGIARNRVQRCQLQIEFEKDRLQPRQYRGDRLDREDQRQPRVLDAAVGIESCEHGAGREQLRARPRQLVGSDLVGIEKPGLQPCATRAEARELPHRAIELRLQQSEQPGSRPGLLLQGMDHRGGHASPLRASARESRAQSDRSSASPAPACPTDPPPHRRSPARYRYRGSASRYRNPACASPAT